MSLNNQDQLWVFGRFHFTWLAACHDIHLLLGCSAQDRYMVGIQTKYPGKTSPMLRDFWRKRAHRQYFLEDVRDLAADTALTWLETKLRARVACHVLHKVASGYGCCHGSFKRAYRAAQQALEVPRMYLKNMQNVFEMPLWFGFASSAKCFHNEYRQRLAVRVPANQASQLTSSRP